MPNRNQFRTIVDAPHGGRLGVLEATSPLTGSKKLETPAIVPGVTIVGGPPGPDRNGGIWRGVKWWMFLHNQIPAFQYGILHPLDQIRNSPSWSGWREKTFTRWITDWQQQLHYPIPDNKRPDNGYPFRTIMNWWPFWRQPPGRSCKEPITFSESTGYALARESLREKCETLGLPITQEAILDLQLEMGADVVMSLDYPISRRVSSEALKTYQAGNIANGLKLLELLAERDSTAIPYIYVHGLNHEGVEAYIDEFMNGWRKLPAGARMIRFGVAVGSLSGIASQPVKLIEIMCGVRAGLCRAATELGYMPPIHVLGISSQIMAVLVYLGADSFSSQTYVEVVKRGQYLTGDLRSVNIQEVSNQHLVDCGCFICTEIANRHFLPELKSSLSPGANEEKKASGIERSYRQTATGEVYTNSDLAALLAMHNWVQITREMERIREAVKHNRLPEYICALATQDRKAERLLRAVEHLAELEEKAQYSGRLKEALGSPLSVAAALMPEVQPFVLPAGYEPPGEKDVLVLVDNPDTVGQIQTELVGQARVHVALLLPGYGVVPAEVVPETLARIPFAPHHEDMLRLTLVDYMSRFRPYYRHQFALGSEGWCSTVEGVATVVATLDDLTTELKGLPVRPSRIQLSLWDSL